MSGTRRAGSIPRLLALVCLVTVPLLIAATVRGADAPTRRGEPHAGYVYPGGAQAGKTTTVKVGGSQMRQVQSIRISGDGVQAKVLFWYPPPRTLNGGERRLLVRRLKEIRDRKIATTPGEGGSRQRAKPTRKPPPIVEDGKEVKLPEHPLLENLDRKTLEELDEIQRYFLIRRSQLQRKRSIEESVKVDVTIAADAAPGMRELRVVTKSGVSNAVKFMVGLAPEINEREPNFPTVPVGRYAKTPIVFNGQIFPRDVDRFRIRATKGQRLLLRAQARSLVPYQADSVPGWMQATIAVLDAEGRELAFADEFRFDPDPVLFFEVPDDGDYLVEVRDAISRGRDDFVYRVTVGELPFVTGIFPLGGQVGHLTNAEVSGWNMNWRRLPLDTREATHGRRSSSWRQGDGVTNEVPYAVGDLPEIVEQEPNDDVEHATPLTEDALIVNGRIDRAGDVDLFSFKGRRGQHVVVDVDARPLGSALDSVIRLVDPKGEVIAWNDDDVPQVRGMRAVGFQTHHADSYLLARLPRSGTYTVRIADVTRHGGPEYAYRLRVGTPRPDAEVFVMPSSINIPAGRAALIELCVIRKDGFEGPVDVELVDAPDGFRLAGGHIPADESRVSVTLTSPGAGLKAPIHPTIVAHFKAGREEITREVRPADDIMQAFLWRHLVPAEELTIAVQGAGKWIPIVTYADEEEPVRVRRGGKGIARFIVTGRIQLKDIQFEPIAAPKGISIGKAEATHDGFTLEIKAARSMDRMAEAENLILEAFVDRMVPERRRGAQKDPKKKNAKPKMVRQRWSLGLMPAIPYRITR